MSYAQNLEDVMLWRALKNVKNGFYIDVGANHPRIDSVTKAFYDNGWTGINVEPEKELYELLEDDRPNDINLNMAVSSKVGSIEFYVSSIRGWSTTSKEISTNLKDKDSFSETRTIQAISLDEICKNNNVDSVHFLKVDVEGAEKDVLESFSFDKVRPWVCVVEATKPTTQIDVSDEWEYILISKKYIFAYFDGLNKYYIAEEHNNLVDLFKSPPNVFDEFILAGQRNALIKASEAEAKASEAEAKASEAEAKASEAEAKASEAEAKASEAEAKASKAEAKASEAEAKASKAEARASAAEYKVSEAEAKASAAEAKASEAVNNYNLIINSNFWKVAKPLRLWLHGVKLLIKSGKGWSVLLLNCRAKRMIKKLITNAMTYIESWPYLKSKILFLLNNFPKIKNSLKALSISGTNKQMELKLTSELVVFYYVDHTCTFGFNTGLQRVTRLLAKSFVENKVELRLIKWNVAGNYFCYLNNIELLNISSFGGPDIIHTNKFSNEQGLFYVDKTHINATNSWLFVPEVPYINNYSLNLTEAILLEAKKLALNTAFIYYDSIPLKRKELSLNAPIHREYMQYLKSVDLIIPISQYSADDFLELSEKIKVVHLPAESTLSSRERSFTRVNNNLILSVGSITTHKNQLSLVKAFDRLCVKNKKFNWRLRLIGNVSMDVKNELDRYLEKNKKIEFRVNASEKVLVESYKECSFTVFPSLEEGFGLPIVESLWFAKPCICADFGAMNEVASIGGTINVNTANVNILEESILTLINDEIKLHELQKEAINAKLKNWLDYGQEIKDILNKQCIIKQDVVKANRIFWLGMHKVLVKTELVRLRELGYEVFNPPYLSNIQDQSANLKWDSFQQTTLPLDVFEKLSSTNFFYESINSDICNILNEYFDTVIVTITPHWLKSILNGYEGKVIFRVYGQSDKLCNHIQEMNLKNKIDLNDKFYFMPHSEESINDEDKWLRKNETIVPYCLTDDIFGYVDAWSYDKAQTKEVAISCPNVSNAYFLEHYNYLNDNFKGDFIKLYGVQLSEVDDKRIVGSMPRHELINKWINSVAYIYTYNDPKVCYLPPIEMMVLGLPVLFIEGCLLDKYYHGINTPARYKTPDQALKIVKRIREGDINLINEIVSYQKDVWKRYSPGYVWPIFDKAINKIIKGSK